MTPDRPLLEIAANSLDSALAAEAGGADRIELCAVLEAGGVTPSPGLVALVRAQVRIPVHVLVRPRPGDFAYSPSEHATMLQDIAACVRAGCDGIVTGALAADGSLDRARCGELAAAAEGLALTLHRAIDVSSDPHQALEDAIALGFGRVLSSGCAADALQGAETLRGLVAQAGSRIVVMPGAGIDVHNIVRLRQITGAREFHASAKRALPSSMRHRPAVALDMEGGEWRSDADAVARLAEALRR